VNNKGFLGLILRFSLGIRYITQFYTYNVEKGGFYMMNSIRFQKGYVTRLWASLLLISILSLVLLYNPSRVEAQLPIPPGVAAKRGDILVIENHYGTHADPENFNYLVPGRPGFGASGFS
jgi:hypothetical protein